MADAPPNPKRELFCRYYTQNDKTFGNATHSYGEAYDYGNTPSLTPPRLERASLPGAASASR